MRTFNDVLQDTTLDYIDKLDITSPPPPNVIEQEILEAVTLAVDIENSQRAKGHAMKVPNRLTPVQVALIVKALYPVYKICTGGISSDEEYDLLAVYQTEGENRGIYVTDDTTFKRLLRQYNFTMSTREYTETIDILKSIVPRRQRCTEKNLIAVNNGIFDYDTKTLMDFTPDLVFMTKSRVDYNPNAINPIIHNDEDGTDWDVESWMQELSDDPDVVNLLWEIMGAIIRPLVPWNKSAWFYSETGNNGKGTLCELMRRLCGTNTFACIPLANMGKDFMLEPLIRASCIIVDENDNGEFIEKAANLKAIITNDVISINRKFKAPIAYQFFGFMVQCLNEMPKLKDKSDSFFRRQLFVPFLKCFTGQERKYIKADYLHRTDVLQYVLFRVLNMNYYTLSEPEACKLALEEYKEYNDPVRQFVEEVLPETKWDLLPFTFLYDMYKSWFKDCSPSGKTQSRQSFIHELLNVIANDPDWECPDKKKKYSPSGRMDICEPLIATYNLTNWMNPKYAHVDTASIQDRCTPYKGQFNAGYRGLIRKGVASNGDDDAEDNGDD